MLEIHPVTPHQAPRWTDADRSVAVERVASLRLVAGKLLTEPQTVPRFVKTYEEDGPVEGDCFVARSGPLVLGEVRTSLNWNGYLYIDNLLVGEGHRGQGVGSALLHHVQERCRMLGLPGVMLETQNTNWPACRLYEKCGFRLGGFDALLYKAIDPDSDEIALFWYWQCAEHAGAPAPAQACHTP
jgi:streptothricin acetyltransferase